MVFNNFNDLIKHLNENGEQGVLDVLSGQDLISFARDLSKNWTEEQRKNMETLAKRTSESGNAAQDKIEEIEKIAKKLGASISFDYDNKRKEITLRVIRDKDVEGDKNVVDKNSITPIKIKLEVGSSKIGYKDGVPAVKNPSFSRYDDQSMLTTSLEDVLINVKKELESVANTKGRSISTKKLKGRIGSVVSEASTGITANSGRASVIRKDLLEDMTASGSIDNAEILKETAKYGNIAYSVASNVAKKIGRPSNKKGFEIDEDRMARDVYLYIMANQAKIFDKKEDNRDFAANILRERGYTDEHIKLMGELIGEEVLSMPSAINLGTDRSAATLTGVLSQAGDLFLENYGRSDRHSTQGRKTIKKLHKSKKYGKYRDTAIFRNEEYDKDGYYERAEKELYTSAEIDSKKFLEKYLKLRKEAEKSIRKKLEEKYKKKNKNIKSEEFEKEVANQLRNAGFSDIIPSLDDDMMITSNSVLKGLKGTQPRSLQITKEEYDHWAKEAMDKVEKSGGSTISFGGRKFNTKKNKRKQDYINAYIASKIKEINPEEIYDGKVESVNLGKNDYGEEIIGLAFNQLVSPVQQGKVLTEGIGQRNYAFAIHDKLFVEILKELGLEGEGVDFIRKKEDIKSNDALQKALAIITNKYKKSENKEEFLKNLKNSPLGSLISNSTNSDGSIYFDPSNEGLKKFAENGGVTKLYEWMDDNGIYNANNDAIIYDTTANLIDTYAWTKRVQTGKKERDAQERTSYISGSTDEYRKKIKERYAPSNYRDKEIQEKAKHDQEEIRKAIMSKTASTGKQSEDEIKKYLSGSYTKGYKGTDKKVISIGSGEGYSLNLDNYIDTIIKYQRGHITEEEFAKTWQHDIEELKKEMIASGIKEEDIDIAIDPGTKFGFSSNGKQFKGRLLHLGDIKPTESIDPVTGKTVYDMPEYTSAINSLFGAIAGDKSDEKSWKNKVSNASVEAIREMNSLAFYNKGAIFERANKLRLGHSQSFKASGVNTDQIDSLLASGKTDEAEKLISNAFISKNAMAKMLLDTHDYETKDSDGNTIIDLEKYKNKLYAQYKNSKLYKKEKLSMDEIFGDKTDLKSIQDAILPKLLNIAKNEGLRGMFNRFPSIDSEAVKNARLFISDNIKQDDIMQIGAGLQKAINADFDGDTVNIILKMLEDYQGDNTEDWDKKIALNLYNKYSERKKEEENKIFEEYAKNNGINGPLSKKDKEKAIKINKEQELKKTLGSADDEYLKRLSGLASKVNNQFIGSLSNMSTAIRGSIYNTKYDETGIKRDKDGNITKASFLDVSKGFLTKALGQTLEQDAISSKKVEKRIAKTFEEEVERINKEKESSGESDFITVEDFAKNSKYEERRKEIATRIINDYNKLVESIYSGDFKNDEEFFDKLKEFGITSNGKFDSLAMSTAVSQIEELSKELNISDEEKNKLFEKIFGKDYTSVLKTGFIGVDSVKNSIGDVSKGLFKGKNGFFWAGDTYNPAAVASRKNNTGTKDDTAEIIRIMKDLGYIGNLEKIEENNDLFDEHGRILRDVSEAYGKEIQMEQLKTVVASKEAAAIEKLGSKYKNLGVVLSEIAKSKNKSIDELTSDDIKEGYRYLPGLKKPVGATQARRMMFSLEDRFKLQAAPTIMDEDLNKALELSKNKGRALTEKEIGETLGLRNTKDINNLKSSYSAFTRGSFVGNTTQLIAELEKIGIDTNRQNGQTSEDYINHLVKLGQNVLADTSKYPGLSKETANVIKSYVDKDNVDEHGEHSDIVTLFEKLKNAEALFSGIDKSFKTDNILTSIENLYTLLNKLGMLGGNLVGTEVGSAGVINGTPFATTADIVSTQTINKDGKEYVQLVHSDIKSHGGDNYTAEDAFQVAMEEYGTRDLIKTLASRPEAFSKDDKSFEAIQKEIISERYRKAGFSDDQIKNIIDSVPVLTKELASKLVETFNAGLDPNISRLIVSNKHTGNATAYNTKLDFDKRSLLEKVFGGENLSKEEAELFMKSGSFAGTTSKFTVPKKEPEKPKTKDDKEAEKKKNQEDFVELLGQEYKLRLKIAELKGKKALSTDDEEKKNLETLIGYNEGLLNKKVSEREKAGKKAGLRGKSGEAYKNNVLLAEEAKYQLELQKLSEKLTKGTGGIAGKRGLFDDFGKQFKGYFVNMFSAYRIISKITQELRKCVQIAKELDKAATNIRIVTGKNKTEVDLLMKSYSGLARELGTTTVAIATSGQEWMRQGYSIGQANDLIVASTHLSKLGMMDMANATKVLTSTLKGFKMEASEAGDVVDKLTKLDMNYATTAADIGEAMSRTAAIANQMGVSLDETAAMVTTIMDITQQSAEMTGTAIRTLMSRYGNVKAGSFVSMLTDGEDLDKINDIEKVLSVLGIEIRNSKLEMKDISVVLDELALKWTTLSDVEKNAVATAFAGTRQRNQFVVLMDNWQQVEEATEMAANSAGTADEKYGAFTDSIEARLNKLQTAWEEFTQKLGASGFVKGAVSALTFLVENLDKILTLLGSISAYLMAKKLWANVGKLGGIFNGLGTIGFKKGAADAAVNPNGGIINRIFGTTQKGFTTVSSKLDQIMAIMRGEQTGDATMSVVDSMTVTQRAELNKANKLEIKNQKEKLKYLKAEEKVHGFDNSTYKVEAQSEIDRLKAQNTALKGKGFNVGNGKTITMRKGPDGNMMYYATTMKNGNPNTDIIDPNSADAKNAQAQKKAQTKQRAAGSAAMGVAAGVMAGMSGTNSYFGNTIGSEDVKINDIESDTTDNIVNGVATGAATGLLSAIPGIGPILGPILGPIIGDGIGGLIKFLRHRDEINRKQRVEEAKKNLEALNKIESATVEVESAIFNINDASSMSAAKESVDKLINTLLDDGENRNKIMNELGSKFGFAVDELGNTTMTTADLEKILLYGTDKEKAIATNTINQITNSESAIEKYKSQEEDRFKNEEKLEESIEKSTDSMYTGYSSTDTSTKGAIMDSLGLYSKEIITHSDGNDGTTYETKRSIVGENAEAIEKNAETAILKMRKIVEDGEFNGKKLTQAEIDAVNAEIESLEAAIKGIDEYSAETEKLNKELHGLELEDAFRSSGLSMWNAVDIANSSLETVIQTFANNLELTGVATRDATGMITEEARQQIETYLRSNEQFSSLFNNGTQTLNDMVSNVSKQNDLVSKTGAKSFDELKDAFDKADAEKIKEFSKAAGIAAEELMGLVYKSDSSQLSSFARALNMTTEDVLALQDKLGSITLSDLIKTPAETREAFNELAGIFSEISTKGSATGETLEKLNSSYFNLYNKYDDLGNIISTGSENLLENLRERLFGDAGSNGTQAFLYQNATFQDLKNNSDMYKSYLSELKNSDVWNSLSDDLRSTFTGAKTLTDVIHLFNSNSSNGMALQNTLSSFLDNLNLNNDYYTELQNKLVEWQKHDNQTTIDGLQSQIDALDEINEEREREIELIKAKDALENAKKEKKRVYRAGVGWTYEADQEKINEAKDKLDEVEREIDKENLQYQIDLLEKQNSMLDNMAKNEELKALKAVFDEYNTYMKNKFGKEVTSGFSEIIDLAESDRTMTWSTYVENMGTEQAIGEQVDITNMINKANDIAYLDSVLSGMLKDVGLTDVNQDGIINESDYDSMSEDDKKKHEKVLQMLHSDKYIERETARKNAYNSFIGSVSNLDASGVSGETINKYLKSGLDSKYKDNSEYNSTSSYTATKYDKANDKYYYLKSGFGASSTNKGQGQADAVNYEENQYLKLVPQHTFKSDQLSAGLNIMRDNPEDVRVDYYDNNLKKWITMPDDSSAINALPSGTIVHIGSDYKDKTSDESHGYAIKSGSGWDELSSSVVKYSSGTFGVDKAVMAMINELGTEGIVTPQGTLTALPSKTGIVPADLTKNLYNLGEVAPNLIKKLGDDQILQTKNLSSLEDNSMSVENFYATFETDNDFDFEKLLISARQYIKNTKGIK